MQKNLYRPEVDGLRAVAVLPVILFHAGLYGFSGGYIGVDVFFVISGFLISQIIMREKAAGTFSYWSFYERRARRLMPALFFVILVSIVFGAMWMTPKQFEDFGQSILYTVTFVANLGLRGETGYFAARADLFPLLHTWSLSVEEQFYVLFPTALILATRFRPKVQMAIFAAIAVVSFLIAEHRSVAAPTDNFYYLTTRAWELLVGVLLAMGLQYKVLPDRGHEALSILGLIMIVAGFILIDRHTPFPSHWALLPVLGTALVLYAARGETMVGRLLSTRPMVFIGVISYPAYLWHQPLFAFARIRSFEEVSPLLYLLLSAVALVLAWLTWRFIERPVRTGGWLSRKVVLSATAVLTLVFVGIGATFDLTRGLPQRLPGRAKEAILWRDDMPRRQSMCHSKPGRTIPPSQACVLGDQDSARVAIWGDSHAMMMTERFSDAMRPYHTGVRDFTFRACSPLVDYQGPTVNAECAAFNKMVVEHLFNDPSIEIVVLHARWALLLERLPFDNGEGGIEGGGMTESLEDVEARTGRTRAEQYSAVETALSRVVSELAAKGKKVVLWGGVPEIGWDLPDEVVRRALFKRGDEEISYPRAVWNARNVGAIELLSRLAKIDGVYFIDPSDSVCGTSERCFITRKGRSLYVDDDHISSEGAAMASVYVVTQMEKAGLISR